MTNPLELFKSAIIGQIVKNITPDKQEERDIDHPVIFYYGFQLELENGLIVHVKEMTQTGYIALFIENNSGKPIVIHNKERK